MKKERFVLLIAVCFYALGMFAKDLYDYSFWVYMFVICLSNIILLH